MTSRNPEREKLADALRQYDEMQDGGNVACLRMDAEHAAHIAQAGPACREPQHQVPHRVVTEDGESWMLTQGGYTVDYGGTVKSLEELRAEHTLRPVEPITDADSALLRETFARAGRKTIATLAAAIEQVFHELRESRGGLAAGDESYQYAERTLIAGRPGSWESALLKEVMLFGNDLNLVRTGRLTTVQQMREAGPNKRVDVECRQALADMLTRWMTGPDQYVEVAATLAAEVSAYADNRAGPAGWMAVADQWLQPGGLATQDFVTCYRLFYSVSDHFNGALL